MRGRTEARARTQPEMSRKQHLPSRDEARIRVLAMPKDTNPVGSIFGGWIMSQMDVAGSIAAVERVGGRVVTVAVDSMEFTLNEVVVENLIFDGALSVMDSKYLFEFVFFLGLWLEQGIRFENLFYFLLALFPVKPALSAGR